MGESQRAFIELWVQVMRNDVSDRRTFWRGVSIRLGQAIWLGSLVASIWLEIDAAWTLVAIVAGLLPYLIFLHLLEPVLMRSESGEVDD